MYTARSTPEPLQLHFLQPAEGAAEGEGQVTLGVQLGQRHGGFQVERHAAVVAFVDQGDKENNRAVIEVIGDKPRFSYLWLINRGLSLIVLDN